MDNPAVFGWIPKWRTAQEEDDYCQLILLRLTAFDSQNLRLDGSQPKTTLSPVKENFTSLDGGEIGTRKGALVVPRIMITEIIDQNTITKRPPT